MMPMSIPWLILALSMLLFIRFLDLDKNMFFRPPACVIPCLCHASLQQDSGWIRRWKS
jgi:ABC-type spermidine/putrescine transport system permease subunit II